MTRPYLISSNDRPERGLCVEPFKRGYHAVYRRGHANFCPGCGRSHWYIGRRSVECAFCSTAMDLEKP